MTAGDNNQHVSIEDLSAYADNEALTPEQRASIEQHLSGCHDCRDELASLQTVSALMADLPAIEAPRSFRLAPADVGMNAPRTVSQAPIPIEPWIVRNQSRFRWAGLAAAVLLVMVISADLLMGTGDDDAADFTLMQDAAEESAPAEEDLDEAPSIMSVDEAEEADEPASEEAAPDAALDGELAEEEEFPVAEDEPAPEDSRQDQPAVEFAPDDAADDVDHPVAPGGGEDMTALHAAEESDGGLSLLQWTGIALALLTVALLGAGFLLPRVWSAFSRS